MQRIHPASDPHHLQTMSREGKEIPLVKLVNNCDRNIVVRNMSAAQHPSNGKMSFDKILSECAYGECLSLGPKGSENNTILGIINEAQSTHGALEFSYDEEKNLGFQLPCNNYSFCAGVELQGRGTSVNFDNQLGYSFPMQAKFLHQSEEVQACSSQALKHPGRCDFDMTQCPQGSTLEIVNNYTGGISNKYCVSPDSNRACVSRQGGRVNDENDNEASGNPKNSLCLSPDPSICDIKQDSIGKPMQYPDGQCNLVCGLPRSCDTPGQDSSNCNHKYCDPRKDIAQVLQTGTHKAAGLGHYLVLDGKPQKPMTMEETENFFNATAKGALLFQESVNKACHQGNTRNYIGNPNNNHSPDAIRYAGDTSQAPARDGSNQSSDVAISYECDGINQYTTRAWIDANNGGAWMEDTSTCHDPIPVMKRNTIPTSRVDMAGNSGLKCPDPDYDTLEITFCPEGSPNLPEHGKGKAGPFVDCRDTENWKQTTARCGAGTEWGCIPEPKGGKVEGLACMTSGDPFLPSTGTECAYQLCKYPGNEPPPGPTPAPPPPPTEACGKYCANDGSTCEQHIQWLLDNNKEPTRNQAVERVKSECKTACQGCPETKPPPAPPPPPKGDCGKYCANDGSTCEQHIQWLLDNNKEPTRNQAVEKVKSECKTACQGCPETTSSPGSSSV